MTTPTESKIEQLLQLYHQMSVDDFFCEPMDSRSKIFTSIFMKYFGVVEPKHNDMTRGTEALRQHISEQSEEEVERFLDTVDHMRLAHIQKFPEIAIKNINSKALSYYIKITFEMSSPELLFYDIKTNLNAISELFRVFTGHFYEPKHNGLMTYVAEYPEAQLLYPNQPIDNLESLDELMDMMQEAVRQTADNLKRDKDKLISVVKSHQ
jgi:hypothetical protein